MEVENFDEIARRIMKNGGQVALEKFPVPGRCWQGFFIDTEGHTFGIFEVDEKAG
jgi:predicted enzyme related to lactoylglutathione lyase